MKYNISTLKKRAVYLLLHFLLLVALFSFVCAIVYFGVTLILDFKFRYQVPIGFGLILSVICMYLYSNEITDKMNKTLAEIEAEKIIKKEAE